MKKNTVLLIIVIALVVCFGVAVIAFAVVPAITTPVEHKDMIAGDWSNLENVGSKYVEGTDVYVKNDGTGTYTIYDGKTNYDRYDILWENISADKTADLQKYRITLSYSGTPFMNLLALVGKTYVFDSEHMTLYKNDGDDELKVDNVLVRLDREY